MNTLASGSLRDATDILPMADAKIPDFGKYRIIELVGEGAMGVVYKARDSVLDRTVAIKVMNESIAQHEDLRKRFLREAQAAGSLQHPNVVTIHDLGELDGHLFIAMEFIDGVDLQRLIDLREPLSLQVKLDIMIDVLAGLAFAHRHGIVHRDIKPANIRICDDGRAKIMDFGIAHLASSSMTSVGSILGTPSYMAPEQITEGKTSPASDVFAVGAVLYQLLASAKPFEGPTLQNVLFKIVTETPRPISELVPGLPSALDHIVQKAMAKEPSERYAKALEMANDLTSVRARLSGPSYPNSTSLSDSVVKAIELSRRKSGRRIGKFASLVGGGVVAASLIAMGWSRLSHSGSPKLEAGDVRQPIAAPRSPRILAEMLSAAERTGTPGIAKTTSKPIPPPVSAAPGRFTAAPIPGGATREEAVQLSPQAVTAQSVVPQPTQEILSPMPAAPSAADIAPAVDAYARAIESRDIGTIRRTNPGLTPEQQRGFEQFFQAARDINVTLRVANIEASGRSAIAGLVGRYDYVTTEGRKERQPVNFSATLRHDGNVWRLVSVR
jgi:serine/threonine protein kinase